jgi:hypothetical protein
VIFDIFITLLAIIGAVFIALLVWFYWFIYRQGAFLVEWEDYDSD